MADNDYNSSPIDAWYRVRDAMLRDRQRYTPAALDRIKALVPSNRTAGTLILDAPSATDADWVRERIIPAVRPILVQDGIAHIIVYPEHIIHAEQPRYDLPSDRVVDTERVITVPRYWLRHIPYIGHSAAIVAISVRQCAYLVAGCNTTASVPVPMRLIQRWANMSPSHIRRILASGVLDGILDADRDMHTVSNQGTPKREPNRYRPVIGLLTAGDATDIRRWLAGMPPDVSIPDIMDALIAARTDILVYPYRVPADDDIYTSPQSLRTVLVDAGRELSDDDVVAADRAAGVITQHGRVITVPWYIIDAYLPRVGSGAVCAYMMMIGCSYISPDVSRYTVTIPGGAACLDKWGCGAISHTMYRSDAIHAGATAASANPRTARDQDVRRITSLLYRRTASNNHVWCITVADHIMPIDTPPESAPDERYAPPESAPDERLINTPNINTPTLRHNTPSHPIHVGGNTRGGGLADAIIARLHSPGDGHPRGTILAIVIATYADPSYATMRDPVAVIAHRLRAGIMPPDGDPIYRITGMSDDDLRQMIVAHCSHGISYARHKYHGTPWAQVWGDAPVEQIKSMAALMGIDVPSSARWLA